MAGILFMDVGGIRCSVRSAVSEVIRSDDPHYCDFLSEGSSPGAADIKVTLESNAMPDFSGMKQLFADDHVPWSMFQYGEDYLISQSLSVREHFSWVARFNRSVTDVQVFCDLSAAGRPVVTNPIFYPLDQLLFIYFLAQREGALLHAAGIEVNDKGYIFPGRSGAGKSTLSVQFLNRQKNGMLSDDRIIVRRGAGGYKCFGTPWPGDAGIAVNKGVPLKGIFFITKSPENSVSALDPATALKRLMKVISIPWFDREVMVKLLDFCDGLLSNIPAYELSFKPDTDVVDFFERFIADNNA